MAVWSEVNRASINEIDRFDAEYYKPEYIEISNTLNKINTDKLNSYIDFVQCGPFGSTIKNNTYISDGVIVARPFNVNSCVFEPDNIVYISEEDVNKKNLSLYDDKDIFFARVGDIRVGILSKTNINKKVTISPNIIATRLNNKKIYPEFVVLFFNTMLGHKQIERALKVVAQPTISTELIRKLKLFIPSKQIQEEVSILFNKSLELKQLSQSLYTQAQELLERELGLDKLFFDKPLSYEARLSEVVGNNRADADYYQIPFRSLGNHLKNLNTIPLGKMATIIKGIEVGSDSYVESGIPFLRVSNIKEKGISLGNSDKYISSRLYSALKCYQPQVGELLLTKDGTPGVCYTVTDEIEGIVSGGIVRLQLHDNSFPKEYLSLVVNSRICKMQIDQECSGALIVHWKPNSIRKLKIPVLSDSTMKELGRLVSESKKALTESRQLLEQAKRRVEELIEQAVQK